MTRRVWMALVLMTMSSLAILVVRSDWSGLAAVPVGIAIATLYVLVQSRRTSYISGEEVLRRQNRIPVVGLILRLGDAVNRRVFGFDRRSMLRASGQLDSEAPPDDPTLAAAAVGGDSTSWEILLGRYRPLATALARRLRPGDTEAETRAVAALHDSLAGFDPTSGEFFSGYATAVMEESIRRR